MQFTPNILINSGKDICNAILSYYYNREMIIIPKIEFKSMDKDDDRKIMKLKIFNFEEGNLLQEIELVQEIKSQENVANEDIENDNGNKSDKSKDEVSDGSDSEPSLDNFDNDQLVKLLPSFPKKKSKKIKFYI